MNKKIALGIIFCLHYLSGLAQITTRDYGYFAYSYPSKNWTVSDPVMQNLNKTWGCQTFSLGKTANFTVTEVPNDLNIKSSNQLSDTDFKQVILNVFSNKSTFGPVEKKSISGVPSKFVKATAITSNGSKVTSLNYILFYKKSLFLIQGIYPLKNESEYYMTLNLIFQSIKLK